MLGLDALVSVANVFYLISYSVRDILWLRILTVVGGTLLMPYYYLQSEPLWAPIGWNLVFLAINVFWITKLILDRRPVPFTDEERRLYKLAFRNMSERDAFKLFRMGAWSSQPAGTVLLTQGQPVNALSLIVEGDVSVESDGTRVDTLGEGAFSAASPFCTGIRTSPRRSRSRPRVRAVSSSGSFTNWTPPSPKTRTLRLPCRRA